MGRQTYIIFLRIALDSEEEENSNDIPIVQDDDEYIKFVVQMEVKYDIEFSWVFDDENVEFSVSKYAGTKNMYGEPDDHVRALLEVVRKYKRTINGSFTYQDDLSGGSCQNIVYIARDYTAMITEFDNDVDINTLEDIPKPNVRIIKLDEPSNSVISN